MTPIQCNDIPSVCVIYVHMFMYICIGQYVGRPYYPKMSDRDRKGDRKKGRRRREKGVSDGTKKEERNI
jgi:hypothetical protein